MKYTTVLLLIALSLQLSAQQHTSVLFLHRDCEPTASAMDYSFTTGAPVDDDARCRQSKRLKTAGTVLIAGGGGMVVVSLGLAAGAVFYQLTSKDVIDQKVEAISISSGVIGGVGMLAILSGIPTLVVGKVHSREYCGDDTDRHSHHHHHVYISTNGTNLALNF